MVTFELNTKVKYISNALQLAQTERLVAIKKFMKIQCVLRKQLLLSQAIFT